MSNFSLKDFAGRLVIETMFYDEEYGAIGNISLVSYEEQKEKYIAYFLPEELTYVIDRVTEWEAYDHEEEGAIGYALATDTEEHIASKVPAEIAAEVLSLAEQHNLMPSTVLFFEEEAE